MPTRNAHARWEGSLKEGKGHVDFGNGAFKAPYSFISRFENGTGTNPEELLAAAHASCFAMALSLILGRAGLAPDSVDATAQVTVSPQDGGFRVTGSHSYAKPEFPASTVRLSFSTPMPQRRAVRCRRRLPGSRSPSMRSSLRRDSNIA